MSLYVSTAVGSRSKEPGGSTEWHVVVPETSAFFRDHFPGRPVLPGVALLEIVRRHAGESDPALDRSGVASLAGVRMRRPIAPDEAFVLRFSNASGAAQTRFHVELHGQRVADGVLSSTPANEDPTGPRKLTAPETALSSVGLLPHGDAARLVTRVIEHTGDFVRCEARVPVESAFREIDTLSAFLGLEMGAQAAAAHECLLASGGGSAVRPRRGLFVGVRSASFRRPTLDADASYIVEAERVGAAPPLFVYRVRVSTEGACVLDARISTHSE